MFRNLPSVETPPIRFGHMISTDVIANSVEFSAPGNRKYYTNDMDMKFFKPPHNT